MNTKNPLKNRGATSNPAGRFEKTVTEKFVDDWALEEEARPVLETTFTPEFAKTIISRNDSPDIGFEQSINPYRGCEHGCIYCYARPSHAYMDLSPGVDFETKIFFKKDAPELLQKELNARNYQCKPIVLGANTDPYQPAEAKFQITRQLLQVLADYNHPVIIITKNALVCRDMDILAPMAAKNLVRVAVSVTSLSRELKAILEPRTTIPAGRIKTIAELSQAGIPVRVMVAPVIPMINDKDLEKILEQASLAGAKQAGYVLIRLPHEVKDLFNEWLITHFPQRAEHVMSLIRQMRGGKAYDATFGKRMRGEGEFAKLLAMRFQVACQRYQLNKEPAPELDCSLFRKKELSQFGQLSLLDGLVD